MEKFDLCSMCKRARNRNKRLTGKIIEFRDAACPF